MNNKTNIEEAKKRLKAIKDAKSDSDSEIALFEFAERSKYIDLILNYIENSISKEVIEKKIEKLENQREKATEQNQMGTGIMLTGGINYLQELLEE